MTDTQEKRRYIQGGPESRGRSGYVTRARFYKWVTVVMAVPVWLFDHTQIYRLDDQTVIETEPYCDLRESQIRTFFSKFTEQGWEVRITGIERGAALAVRIKLTSPHGWQLSAAEVPIKYTSQGQMSPPPRELNRFLP